MDSFLSGFSHNYAAGGQQIGQSYSSGVSGGANTGAVAASSQQGVDVTQLQAGDTFQGEIASVNGEDVQIQLVNGQYMTAKLERDVQVALGQVLNLQVLSNKDNRIVLKPVYDNNMQLQRVGESALRMANLAVTDKNLQLVSKLIENGMPINKNTLMTFNRLALQHPQADVAQIIKLTKLQLPVTDKNLTQYENYQNLEHKLLEGIKDASNEILDLYDTIAGRNAAPASGTILPGAALGQAQQYMEKVLGLLADAETEQPGVNNTPVLSETASVDGSISMAKSGVASILPEDAAVQNTNVQNREDAQTETVIKETIQNEHTPNAENTVLNKESLAADKQQSGVEEAYFRDTAKQLKEAAPQDLPEKIVNLIKDGNLDIKGVKWLLSEPSLAKALTLEQKNEIFTSEPFKAMVRKEIQKQWTLSPQELTEPGKMQEFYEKLVKQSNRLLQIMNNALNESGQEANGVQSRAMNNIHENVEFMNQMNQMFNYVQLPLRLSNSQAHGDLYVYTNKKNLARKEGTLTAFLHLDMENLGGVDVSVSLQTEKNQVSTKFYLEEEAIALIEEHIDELTQRLAKRGYQCKNVIQVKDGEKTVLQRMEEQVAGGTVPLSYQTFDIRA